MFEQKQKIDKTTESLRLRVVHGKIMPGDLYLSFGNPKLVELLTCKDNNEERGVIIPEESLECFCNSCDCRKVVCI